MNRQAPAILGRAIFGTSDGLTVQGNGMLSSPMVTTSGILEFDVGRLRGKGLDALGPGGLAVFRRRVVGERNRHMELLGLVAPCRDRHNRVGFVGACVAIDSDRLGAGGAIHDWRAALAEAHALFARAHEMVDPETRQLGFPRQRIVAPASGDADIALTIPPGPQTLWYVEDSDQDAGMIERLQALAFMAGETVPSIVAFMGPVPEARPLGEAEVDRALASFREKTARRPPRAPVPKPAAEPVAARPGLERDLQIYKREMELAAASPVGPPGAPSAETPDRGDGALEARVARLENDIDVLRREIEALRRPSAGAAFAPQPGTDTVSMRRPLVLGGAAAVALLAILGAVLALT